MSTPAATNNICILLGSSRDTGNCVGLLAWLKQHLQQELSTQAVEYTIVDINGRHELHPRTDVIDDVVPAMVKDSKQYALTDVQRFSQFIQSCSGVIMLTPQYNWSVPSTLKRAIDALYHEWRGKPMAFVTYGGHGGSKCDEHLRQIAVAIKADVVNERVQVSLPEQYIRASDRVTGSEEFLKAYDPALKAALQQLIHKVNTAGSSTPTAREH